MHQSTKDSFFPPDPQSRAVAARILFPSRAAGFTLVELVIVIGIIILVLAIAVPVWNALLGGNGLAAAQNQIAGALTAARSDAIYYHQTIGLFFFIDPKTQQTALAEVQVQTLYQQTPAAQATGYTSLFYPSVTGPQTPNNNPVNSLELVNYYDPTNSQYVFYRDVVLLPAGVSVALNSDILQYNPNNITGGPATPPGYPALDRYTRVGAIMFAPDGTLTRIPYAVPNMESFTYISTPPTLENALSARMGFPNPYGVDFGSIVAPLSATQTFPLLSSVGLVIYDHNIYLNQHASMQISNGSGGSQTIGNTPPDPFTDYDLEYITAGEQVSNIPSATDKFIEENWIDQNGTALMVSPFNGSLIKAK